MSAALQEVSNRTTPSPSDDVRALGRLMVKGADRQGIVAAVTSILASFGANIVSLDQHLDNPDGGRFFHE